MKRSVLEINKQWMFSYFFCIINQCTKLLRCSDEFVFAAFTIHKLKFSVWIKKWADRNSSNSPSKQSRYISRPSNFRCLQISSSQFTSSHLKSSQVISSHLKPSQAISDHFKSFQANWSHFKHSAAVSSHLKSSKAISSHYKSFFKWKVILHCMRKCVFNFLFVGWMLIHNSTIDEHYI